MSNFREMAPERMFEKIMPGGGDFVSFFRPGGRSFALKSCLQGGDFDEKN